MEMLSVSGLVPVMAAHFIVRMLELINLPVFIMTNNFNEIFRHRDIHPIVICRNWGFHIIGIAVLCGIHLFLIN